MFRKDIEISSFEAGGANGPLQGQLLSFADKYVPYVNRDRNVATRLGKGRTPDIKDEDTEDIGINYHRYSRTRGLSLTGDNDFNSRDSKEKDSSTNARWAKLDDHLNVDEMYNHMKIVNEMQQAEADFENIYD